MMRLCTAAILAAMTGFSTTAWSVTYACQITGEVADSCCCKSSSDDACATIQATCTCCDVQMTDSPPQHSSSLVPVVISSVPAPAQAIAAAPLPLLADFLSAGSPDESPPGSLPPAFLLNQSLRR